MLAAQAMLHSFCTHTAPHHTTPAATAAAAAAAAHQALRPKLSEEQKAQLEECFELMDADGSGAIDADELGAAFKVGV